MTLPSGKDDVLIAQQIVEPSQIESGLLSLWDKLKKENKTRASLFNLIVFNRFSSRTDYIRSIVQKVVERFPCRTLFIANDPEAKLPYLKTAISVVSPQGAEGEVACDQIDIGIGGGDLERIPFLILPHLTPDLPVYLLWTEDLNTLNHPLFTSLSNLATRIIFDSESADNMLSFSQTLLDLRKTTGIDIADLNWARTEGWRDLTSSLFDHPQRLYDLKNASAIKIIYNAQETEFFCHLKIQSMYYISWLAARLGWKFEKLLPQREEILRSSNDQQVRSRDQADSSLGSPLKEKDCTEPPVQKGQKDLRFQFDRLTVEISSENWKQLGPGTIIASSFQTQDKHLYAAKRIFDQYHQVQVEISSPERCELPYQFVLGKTATGQSLVKEICTKGTSPHYLETLEMLKILDQENLC